MEPLFELEVRLPERGSRELLRALHGQLRAAIVDGRLRSGLKLPPTRALAAQLGVSRNTAVAAYDLLLSEGYLVARPGAGTYVAELLPRRPDPAPAAAGEDGDPRLGPYWRSLPRWHRQPESPAPVDFSVGLPDGRLPFQIWRRLSSRALQALARERPRYAEPEGRPALREAIAGHISFTRAVACRPEDVVVTAGAQQAFDLLARILVTPGETVVALEDPGYPPLRAAFAAAGAAVRPVPVDDEGLVVERVPREARVVCVTPSHQFPLGVVMSPRRRAALLELAEARGAVVIEDDYDSEFRFGGRPLDALQTLDRAGSVFYVGTFSKSLFPALRLGFVVAPAWARAALLEAKLVADWHAPRLTQDTLAAFIAEGHLARHIRKMRRLYGERRALLLRALERHFAGRVFPIPGSAGLHLTARLAESPPAAELVAKAAEAGVRIEPLDRYAAAGRPNGLVFGYGTVEAGQIEPAIRRLAA